MSLQKLDDYLEKILEEYSSNDYASELADAKAAYFKKSGNLSDGIFDEYDGYMQSFLDWYLFERSLKKDGQTPVSNYIKNNKQDGSGTELTLLDQLDEQLHSLFEYICLKDKDVYIRELFEREVYILEDFNLELGLKKGDVFEGRLLPFGDRFYLRKSILVHPHVCRSIINKSVKKLKTQSLEEKLKYVHRLALNKIKSDQYPHVDVKTIYSGELSF